MYKNLQFGYVMRKADGACIPPDPTNTDYAAFLTWQSAGGVPDPADLPDPNLAVISQITSAEAALTPRMIRECLLGNPASLARLAAADDAITKLRAKLK